MPAQGHVIEGQRTLQLPLNVKFTALLLSVLSAKPCNGQGIFGI